MLPCLCLCTPLQENALLIAMRQIELIFGEHETENIREGKIIRFKEEVDKRAKAMRK